MARQPTSNIVCLFAKSKSAAYPLVLWPCSKKTNKRKQTHQSGKINLFSDYQRLNDQQHNHNYSPAQWLFFFTHRLSDCFAPEADLTFLLKRLVTLQRAGWIRKATYLIKKSQRIYEKQRKPGSHFFKIRWKSWKIYGKQRKPGSHFFKTLWKTWLVINVQPVAP